MGDLFDASVPTFVFFEWAHFSKTWSLSRQRPHHLARALAKNGFQVVCVEAPSVDGVDTLNFIPLESGIFCVRPRSAISSSSTTYLQQLDKLLPEAPWVIHHPIWTPILRDYLHSSRTIIYDCMDEWSEFVGSPRDIVQLETELAAKADLVLATGLSLYMRMKLINSASAYVSNAVYAEDFAKRLPEAADLRDIPRPRLLFVGFLGTWVDLDLIRHIATARPEWSLVMVGRSGISSSDMPQEENIFWLGEKPYTELGAYMAYCDVGLIPFKQDKLTRAVNPLKVHEYVVSGLPVVSTFLPDLLLFDDPGVKVTSTYEGFLEALERTLVHRPKPRGATGVQSGTWDEKVAQILSRLDNVGFEDDEALMERFVGALSTVAEEEKSNEIVGDLAFAHYVGGHYEKVLEFAPAGSSLRRAAFVRLGRCDDALSELRASGEAEALSSWFGVDAWPKEVLGAHVLLSNGEPLAALEMLNRASTFEPAHHLVFARVYATVGLFAEAVTAYAQVIDVQPSLMGATDFLTVGDACRGLGLDEKAEEFYLRAHELGLTAQVEEKLSGVYFKRALSLAEAKLRD